MCGIITHFTHALWVIPYTIRRRLLSALVYILYYLHFHQNSHPQLFGFERRLLWVRSIVCHVRRHILHDYGLYTGMYSFLSVVILLWYPCPLFPAPMDTTVVEVTNGWWMSLRVSMIEDVSWFPLSQCFSSEIYSMVLRRARVSVWRMQNRWIYMVSI